jgi:hypothetical protein
MNQNIRERRAIIPLLLKREAAEIIGGTELLSQLMRRKQIAFIKLGHRSVRFKPEEVEAALARLTVRAVV